MNNEEKQRSWRSRKQNKIRSEGKLKKVKRNGNV